MTLNFRLMFRRCLSLSSNELLKYSIGSKHQKILSSKMFLDYPKYHTSVVESKYTAAVFFPRKYCTQTPFQKPPDNQKKSGVIQRFKAMYRDYWYVLVPVHLATSAVWLGTFYYAVRSGIDVIHTLEAIGLSERIMEPLRDSKAGYFALTFALYKIATPLRYAVTLGGTTYAIKKLTDIGWIKPVPSKERIKEMIQEQKDILQEKRENFQDRLHESKQHYQNQMKTKSAKVMEEMRRYKTEIRNMKNKVKKM